MKSLSTLPLPWLALCATVLVASPAYADDPPPKRPVAVDVPADAPEIDAEALRAAVERELGLDVVTGVEPPGTRYTFLVSIDRARRELIVERRDEVGGVSRHVPLPADPKAALHAAAFLIGNLARDEASELVQQMPPRAPPPPAPPPSEERERAPAPAPPADEAPKVWLTVQGGVDLLGVSSENPTCVTGGAYTCLDGSGNATYGDPTNPFPPNVRGGLAWGPTRILGGMDFTVSPNLLLGWRGGHVGDAYPGPHAVFASFHVEGRATYVFGDAPLAHPGFAPFVMGAAGLSQWAASVAVQSPSRQYAEGATGPSFGTNVRAWEQAGPVFVSAGPGLRWQLAKRFALFADMRFNLAFGTGAALFAVTPLEIGAQVGVF